MGLLNLLIQDPLTFLLLAIPLLYSIIIHELPTAGRFSDGGSHGQIYGPADAQSTQASRSHRHGDAVHLRFWLGQTRSGQYEPDPEHPPGAHLGLFPRGLSPTCCSPLWPSCCFACSLRPLRNRSDGCSIILRRSTSCSPRSISSRFRRSTDRRSSWDSFRSAPDTFWPVWNLTDSSSSSGCCTWAPSTRSSISSRWVITSLIGLLALLIPLWTGRRRNRDQRRARPRDAGTRKASRHERSMKRKLDTPLSSLLHCRRNNTVPFSFQTQTTQGFRPRTTG